MECVQSASEGAILCVRLQPRASRDEIAGVQGGRLKIKVKAPPVEGAANEACRELLAKKFGLARSRVRIVSGGKSRRKRILLAGVERQWAADRLSEAVKSL